ncbi:MAG: 5-bromo-4-chloroindolyl phosphate hydrolysis family protein [Pseudomonadota bacterium]
MSGKRFGGQYSPGGGAQSGTGPKPVPPSNKFRGQAATSVDIRGLLLFVLPTPLLLGVFSAIGGGEPLRLIMLLAAYGALMLGAWLVREGQKAHAVYDARDIARPPAFPRKLCAAGLAAIGVALASWLSQGFGGILETTGQMLTALIFGAVAAVAHVLAFGIDPMKSKGLDDAVSAAELERVTDALDKAEAKLKSIEDYAHKLRDREIDERVSNLNATVRDMIKIVEKDPRDLSRARRYLGVYLKGAEDATRKYAENHERLNEPKIRDDYLALLKDLEASFTRGKDTLLLDDKTDLEVEIEVLRDRLGQEGA